MKRSICAAFVSMVSLVPLSLGSMEAAGTPFSVQPTHSLVALAVPMLPAPGVDYSKKAAQLAAKKAELAKKQKVRKLAQKKTKAMRIKMARSALYTAKKMASNGWCYKGVTDALKPLGVELFGPAAYMAKDLLDNDPRFKQVRAVEPAQLHPGDVIVHGPTGSHPYGHIAVYLGNNHEASDHVQDVVLNAIGPYSYSVVFRYDEQYEYITELRKLNDDAIQVGSADTQELSPSSSDENSEAISSS